MPGDSDDSSDYGSDFTPDEEELLNDLLAKVATGHATAQASATATATATATTTTTVQATVSAVADIEEYAEAPASQRVPKVLGREKPGSLWQKRNTWQVSTSAGARADQISGSICAASGEDIP
jgi:exonuclease V